MSYEPYVEGLQHTLSIGAPRIFQEEAVERLGKPGVIDDFWEMVFTIHSRAVAHLNSQQLKQHAQGLHKLQADKISAWRR